MKHALVTGAAGFVGRWVCAALLREGWSVSATAQLSVKTDTSEANAPWGSLHGVHWTPGDIRDPDLFRTLISASRPDAIIHLAAISHVQVAGNDLAMAWDVNLLASVRLLDAVSEQRELGAVDPVLLLVGSAEQYGRQDDSAMPLREEQPQFPITVYGATKAAQEIAGIQAFRSRGLKVITTRSFPHSGPGQDPNFLIPALFGRAVALKREPAGTPMIVGNVTPVRDFLHVSDVAAAYISLLDKGKPGRTYNVASGIGLSVREVANRVLGRVGVETTLEEDPTLVRPVDVPVLVGDATRLTADTGWRPTRRFDDILDDLFHETQKHAATL